MYIYIYSLWFVSVKIIIKLAGFLFFPRSFFICVESLPGILSQPTVKQFRFYFFSCLYRKNISFLLPSRHLIFAPWRNILMYIKFVFRINIISAIYIASRPGNNIPPPRWFTTEYQAGTFFLACNITKELFLTVNRL